MHDIGETATGAAVGRVRAATVFVGDLERARRFYLDVLGFEERTDGLPGAYGAEVAPPGATTSLVLVQPTLSELGIERASIARQRIGEPTGLLLETADLDATCRRLRTLGVETGDSPLPGPAATLHDPDGNELVLVEAPQD
ncbi:MAG TPA: VOC family protein [Gaiellaceae bacterium]|nr:VOC family protein [Gaiellaceae bacterium]